MLLKFVSCFSGIMDHLYQKLEDRINHLPLSYQGGDNNGIVFTKPCMRPLLKKSMEHAVEESGLSAGIFSPEMNLFRCFMRLLFQNASSEQEKRSISRFVHHHFFFFFDFHNLFMNYVHRIECLQTVRRVLSNQRNLRDVSFFVFRIRAEMMCVSLFHIQKKIEDVLNVWDIGVCREDIIGWYLDDDRMITSIAHTLLEDNDLYGTIGMKQLFPDLCFRKVLQRHFRMVGSRDSWKHITGDLYHHDSMPHPEHLMRMPPWDAVKEDSYATKASFPFHLSPDAILYRDGSVGMIPAIKKPDPVPRENSTPPPSPPMFLEKISFTGPTLLKKSVRCKSGAKKHQKCKKKKQQRHMARCYAYDVDSEKDGS